VAVDRIADGLPVLAALTGRPKHRGFTVKSRNVWFVTFLIAALAMSLELLVFGWQETLLRFESFIVLGFIYFPLLALAFVFGFPLCGLLGLWIAARKLRSSAEGFFLGFVLGPVGVMIEAALPDEWPRGAKK
jgi:hypothetical protein